MLWCIFWTVLATWFVLGMYSVFTTYSFSFNYIGKIFALAFAYGSKYLGLIFGYAVGFIILILLGFLAYLLIRYSKQVADKKIKEKKQELENEYNTKKQELEQEYSFLKEKKEQELQQLQQKIERYIKTEEDIENLKQAIETLFNEILLKCYSFVSTNESLLEALRAKHIKQLKMALKNGVMNEKEVKKKTERFEKLIEDVKGIIEKEIWDYNGFIIETDDLTRMIEEVKKEYAGQ